MYPSSSRSKDWAKTQATRLRCLGTHLMTITRNTPNSRHTNSDYDFVVCHHTQQKSWN